MMLELRLKTVSYTHLDVYKRQASFSKEMARSVRVAMKAWDGRLLNPKAPNKR